MSAEEAFPWAAYGSHAPFRDNEGLYDAGNGTPIRQVKLTRTTDIFTKRLRFLWDEIIPLGVLAAFSGRGGIGKSVYLTDVLARITRGELPGEHFGTPKPVLYWAGEDDWATVIKPRFDAAGGNPELLYKLEVEVILDGIGSETVPSLPLDLEALADAVRASGAAVLALDPITTLMHAADLHREADVRIVLDGLARVAAETGVTVIYVRHFNKGAGNASDKMSGSHAFRDAARCVLLFAWDTEQERVIVTHDKGNYSQTHDRSWAYQLANTIVTLDDGDLSTVPKVVDLGDVDVTVGDVINGSGEAGDDRNAAQAFLVDLLSNSEGGEAAAAVVLKAGRAAGFTENEMKHARVRCRHPRIESRRAGFGRGGGWVWALDEGATDSPKVPKVPGS